MNERIAELAVDTTHLMEFGGEDLLETTNGKVTYQIPAEFIETFAKLVIKETLDAARAGIEYGDGMEDAVYRYFGVEQ